MFSSFYYFIFDGLLLKKYILRNISKYQNTSLLVKRIKNKWKFDFLNEINDLFSDILILWDAVVGAENINIHYHIVYNTICNAHNPIPLNSCYSTTCEIVNTVAVIVDVFSVRLYYVWLCHEQH